MDHPAAEVRDNLLKNLFFLNQFTGVKFFITLFKYV